MTIGKYAPLRAATVSPTPTLPSINGTSFHNFLHYSHAPNHTQLDCLPRRRLHTLRRRPSLNTSTQHAHHIDGVPLWSAITAKPLFLGGRQLSTGVFRHTIGLRELQIFDNDNSTDEVDDWACASPEELLDGRLAEPRESTEEEHMTTESLNALDESKSGDVRPAARLCEQADGSTILQLLLPDATSNELCRSPVTERPSTITITEASLKQKGAIRQALKVKRAADGKQMAKRKLHPNGPTWARLLKVLDRRTEVVPKRRLTRTIRGPENVVEDLYHNLLNDPQQGLIAERPKYSFGKGYLRVSGPADAVAAMKDRLEKPNDPSDNVFRPVILGGELQLSTHNIPAHQTSSRRFSLATETRSATDIPQPPRWTKDSLHRYVLALVQSRKLSSITSTSPNRDTVEVLLEQVLFECNTSRAVLSWASLHAALSYLVDQRRLISARRFLWKMQDAGFTPSTESYNIVLLGCAKEQHLAAFGQFLGIMHARGLSPNDRTWLALLIAAPTVEAKQTIARVMQQKNLHAVSAFSRDDAAFFIPFSIVPFLKDGGDLTQYIKIIDELLGVTWLNDQAAAQLVDELASELRFFDCVKVLDIAKARRGAASGKLGFHKFLAHCGHQLHVNLAIWLVVYAASHWPKTPLDHITMELLFRMARKARMHNLSRVVWKYAATRGELKTDMRVTVLRSLERRFKPATVGTQWTTSFGAVVCDIDTSSEHEQSAQDIMHRERQLFGKKPALPFTHLLVEALLLDREWATKGMRKCTDTAWMIANAIRVPMRKHTRSTHDVCTAKLHDDRLGTMDLEWQGE